MTANKRVHFPSFVVNYMKAITSVARSHRISFLLGLSTALSASTTTHSYVLRWYVTTASTRRWPKHHLRLLRDPFTCRSMPPSRRKSHKITAKPHAVDDSGETLITKHATTTAARMTPLTEEEESSEMESPALMSVELAAAATSPSSTPPHKSLRRLNKRAKKKNETEGELDSTKGDDNTDSPKLPKKRAKKKAAAHQVLTERDELPRLWDPSLLLVATNGSTVLCSWNVAGLRALLKKEPNALSTLVKKYNIDVLCLQETKLQEMHVNDPKLQLAGHLLEAEGYDSYWSCSTAKKGYSGTAAFVKRRTDAAKTKGPLDALFGKPKESRAKSPGGTAPTIVAADETLLLLPEKVSFRMGVDKHDGEGRLICLDYPLFSLVNVYVPNSGQALERLDYRTNEWDKDLLNYVQQKKATRGVPVIWLGDLNVAHTNLEVWNDGAKHLATQAGVTQEERDSFQNQLEAGYIDVFRKLHPDAKGHYSYWSMRASNRVPNKGLRLDYFIGDPHLFDETSRVVARDSYIVREQEGSDHCPVMLELEIKK